MTRKRAILSIFCVGVVLAIEPFLLASSIEEGHVVKTCLQGITILAATLVLIFNILTIVGKR